MVRNMWQYFLNKEMIPESIRWLVLNLQLFSFCIKSKEPYFHIYKFFISKKWKTKGYYFGLKCNLHLQCHHSMWLLLHILAALVPEQLLAGVLRKQLKAVCVLGYCTHMGEQDDAPGSAWPKSSCGGHPESELVDGRAVSPFFSFPLSPGCQINK